MASNLSNFDAIVQETKCKEWQLLRLRKETKKKTKLNIALAEAHYEETSADLSARLHDLIPTDTIQLAGFI